MRWSHRKTAVIPLAFLVVVAVSLGVWFGQDDNVTPPAPPAIEHGRLTDFHKTYWRSVIATAHGDTAWQFFKEVFSDEPSGQQHELAHEFGRMLFEERGLDGVAVCDNDFSFGCYHEFLGQAIAKYGMEVVPELNEKCRSRLREQALGCQHGIGHGIAAASGYEYEDLVRALDECDRLPFADPIGGCKGGVLMEWNMRTVLSVDSDVGVRGYHADDGVYWPCDTLVRNNLPACYYWQSQWWNAVFRQTYGKRGLIPKEGAWCSNVEDFSLRKQCYRGIGNNIPAVVGWDVAIVREGCVSIEDRFGAVQCLGAAASSFAAIPQHKSVARELCEGLLSSEEEECRSIARLSDPGSEFVD